VDDGEAPETAVRRELEEEVGLRESKIHLVGTCYANPSSQTNKLHCYIALGGTFDGARLDEPGADFQVVKMPLDELMKIIENQSETMQSLHLANIFFALNFLKNHPRKTQ
jgi:ADP-ribose pyrophosphatase